MSLTFCIFSYNRGPFLNNCVLSIRESVPNADIIVFDDGSDDKETIEYLGKLANCCRIVHLKNTNNSKHGGLYGSMNAALRLCATRRLVCFLQDDSQVVRPIKPKELQQIDSFLTYNSASGFVHPCFLRASTASKRPVVVSGTRGSDFFYRAWTGQSAGIHYSDLIIFRPERLLGVGWSFKASEAENDRQAENLFGQMAYLWMPFAMWLPAAPAYRGKKKTFGLRLAEKKKRCGFYPFRILAEDEISGHSVGSFKKLPIAEEFLTCSSQTPPKPWTYNALSGEKVFKLLNNVELVMRRWVGRLTEIVSSKG